MDDRPALGRRGEDAAAEFYERSGFSVLERNYRCAAGELDVVASDGTVLVFCEVKTRRSAHWGEPSEAVGFKKQRRIRRLAATWLAEKGGCRLRIRFDVVSILASDGSLTIEHIPDAF
jgi:putative endonuclease